MNLRGRRHVKRFEIFCDHRSTPADGRRPYEALRTSTTTPFEYLGEIDKAGTIAVGKYSDIVLIDSDPLKDIANTSKVSGVLMRGRWLAAGEITRRMKEIEAPL